jgi:pyridoxine 5-phosphate synthase
MRRLSVNIDHVATLRQARRGKEPDPVAAAVLAELAGAEGIIVHLREDRRHIQDRDLELLRKTIKTRLNLEMANTEEMIRIALRIKPDLVTFVPEKRQELTTEGGLDVAGNRAFLRGNIARLRKEGIPASLFIDADSGQIRASREVGGRWVEIHTGKYADEEDEEKREREFRRILRAVREALALKLRVNVGHGLNYQNVGAFRSVAGIEDFSIGHSIISRAVLVGLDRAVREMKSLIRDRE